MARLELLGSGVAFALMAVLARRTSRGAEGFSAGQLSLVRFALGALVSLAAFRLRPGLYRPHDRRRLVLRGLSGGVVVVLYFWALSRIPAAEAGMLYNLFPVLATGMALFAFRERPTVHLLLALATATAGVLLVLGSGSLDVRIGAGQLAALGAAVFAAASANLMRGMRGTDNAPTIFYWFCLAGMPVVAPFSLGPWPTAPAAWLGAVGVGLSAFVAQVLMADAYGALAVGEAALWLQLTPLAQAALAVPLLGESLGAAGLLGLLLGVIGVTWGTLRGSVRPAGKAAGD